MRWRLVAGVLAVFGVAVLVLALARTDDDDDDELDAQALCEMLDVQPRVPPFDAELIVFMQPYATQGQRDRLESVVAELLPGAKGSWTTSEAALEEYRSLFADEPETLEVARADDLPPSLRVTTPTRVEPDVVERLQELDNVLRVYGPHLQHDPTTIEVLAFVFAGDDPGRLPIGVRGEEDTAVGLSLFARDIAIDPTVAEGDPDLEDDLDVLARGVESLVLAEVPDSAVVSATERVLASYDELCGAAG